ncbi:MAG: integral rane sensor signal transduction histidine kinase [Myxococcales bacterium]|nr:integral rane sensor signal transduction histidine kinase [Myxococcales bacterium]
MSLRTRLLAGLAVLVFAAVATAGWSVLAVARVKLHEAEDARASVIGAQIVALVQRACAQSCQSGDVGEVARTLVDGGAAPEVVVVDGERRLIAASGDVRSAQAIADPRLGTALAGIPSLTRSGDALFYYAPLRTQAGRPAGAVRVRMPGDEEVARALHDARLLLVGVTLFDGGLVLLFGALFIRRVVEPIEGLSAAARRVADGQLDLPPVPKPRSNDELAHLVDDFNRMTVSLRRQREQMVAQEKLATVGRLAAGVAHEIGNPLAAVLGYVDLLLHDEPPDGAGRDSLERIRKETDRIREIVAELLDYSRPVTGTVEGVRLVEAVDLALSLVKPQARWRDVEVARVLPDDLPAAATSQSRLVQVLLNLFLNAADAMDGAGTITVRGRGDGDMVELVVADSGPGVADDNRGLIFDPFFSTKEPGKGTGLGLSISRSIIEAYGGTLTLAASDAGATFIVRLPMWRG